MRRPRNITLPFLCVTILIAILCIKVDAVVAEELPTPGRQHDPYYDPDYEVQPVRNLLRPGLLERRDYEPAKGITYYASALGGHDGLSGRWPQNWNSNRRGSGPWNGLTKANRTLVAGDRVLINSGIFTDTIKPAQSGAPGAPIQYIGWMPCVYLESDVMIDGKSDIVIRGLYLTKGNIRITNSKNIRIEENIIAGGSLIIENSANVTLTDSTFYSLTPATGQAIVIRRSNNVTLENNRVHNYAKAIVSNAAPSGIETTTITSLTDHPDKTNNKAGKDYYVIQGIGNDAASGLTPTKAFQSLAKAASVVLPGDRVFVGTGLYAENIRLNQGGRMDAPISVIGFQPGVIIAPDTTFPEDKTYAFSANAQNYITIENIEFRHAHLKAGDSRGITIRNNLVFEANIELDKSSGFLVEGNRVARSWLLQRGKNIGFGIAASQGSSDGTIRQNVTVFQRNNVNISGIRSKKTGKVDAYAKNIIYEGNLTAFHGEHGVSVMYTRDLILRRNIFCWGVNGHPYFGRNDMQGTRIYNNTWHRASWYIQPWPDKVSLHRRNEFRNNIFDNLGVSEGRIPKLKYFTYMPLEPVPGEREFTLDYSLYFPARGIALINNPERTIPNQPPRKYFDTLAEWQAGSGNDMHSLTGDPEFMDPVTLDFRLKPASPCIDAGDPNAPVPEGGGDRVDIGVFEFRSAAQKTGADDIISKNN